MPQGVSIQAGVDHGPINLEGDHDRMPMLAEIVDAVVGGDTHRDTHALEMTTPAGATIATLTINNDEAGFAEAIAFIAEHAPGPNIAIGLEGTRSYGIGLARALVAAGLNVVEIARPHRGERRRGKSDPIDAHLAALHLLRLDADRLPEPRMDGNREALRILLSARTELTTSKTRQVNRLRALLLSGSDTDRDLARGTLTAATLTGIARRRAPLNEGYLQAVRRAELRRLAIAVRTDDQQLQANKKQLIAAINDTAPALLGKPGVGPVSAAQAIVSFSHPGRCRDDAAFAALAGASPIPASSGRITRHRLNHGGDRALNRALHNIVLTRWRSCQRTGTYIARRRREGKSDNEIRRALKRYIARELYRTLNTELAT